MSTTVKFIAILFVVGGVAHFLGLEWLLWTCVAAFVVVSAISHFWSIPHFIERSAGPKRLGGVTPDEMFMLMVADQQKRLKNRSS